MSCTCNTWQRWLLTAVLVALSVLFVGSMSACNDNSNNGNTDVSGSFRSNRSIKGSNVTGLDTLVDAGTSSLVVAALQSGPADYGRGTIGAAGQTVLVLTRFDDALQPLWQTVLDAGFGGGAPHIAFDPSGNIVLTVSGFDNVELGQGTLQAPLVASFSIADGSVRWASSLARQPAPDPRFIVSDPVSGDVFVVSNVLAGTSQVWVDRLSAAGGASIQSRQIGLPSGNMAVDSVAIDGDGNLLLAGTFDGQLRFQQTQLQAVSGQSWGYVAKIGKDSLAALWARPLRLRNDAQHVVIGTLDASDLAIAGQFAFADDTSDTANPVSPLAYLRIGRLGGANGATAWTTRSEQPNLAQLALVDVADFTGDLYMTMTFNGSLAVGGTTAVSTAVENMAIVHASGADGTPVWLRYSVNSATQAGRVGIDSDGNPETAGAFTATADDGSLLQSIYIIEVVN
jgi:hypothetical protein